jgi:hypothetical protein
MRSILAGRSPLGREDLHLRPAPAGGVGEALAEVAGRGTHPGERGIEPLGEQGRSATLEASDRVQCLDLDEHLATELCGEALGDKLRRVHEDAVDRSGRGLDSIEGQVEL